MSQEEILEIKLTTHLSLQIITIPPTEINILFPVGEEVSNFIDRNNRYLKGGNFESTIGNI